MPYSQVTSSETTKNILETARPGQNVLKFTTNEQNVEYYVTSVMSNGQAQPAYFSMSPRSLGQLQTAMLLDRDEGFVKYNVEIYVRDKGSNLPRTTKIDVSVTVTMSFHLSHTNIEVSLQHLHICSRHTSSTYE